MFRIKFIANIPTNNDKNKKTQKLLVVINKI